MTNNFKGRITYLGEVEDYNSNEKVIHSRPFILTETDAQYPQSLACTIYGEQAIAFNHAEGDVIEVRYDMRAIIGKTKQGQQFIKQINRVWKIG